MIKVLVFDVNETLLDLRSLNTFFENKFGSTAVTKEWFDQFIQNSFVSTITNIYQPFGKIALAALEMLGKKYRTVVTDEDKMELANMMKSLPAHPEVKECLIMAKELGYSLVTLTNSTEEVVSAQLKNAGIFTYFDFVFSADSVKRLKPAPDPYQLVATELKLPQNELMLVAAHSWDIEGALSVGSRAAFISRPGKFLNPLASKPQIVAEDLFDFLTKLKVYREIEATV
jgi:2-haloacid dehalogenase